MAVATQHEHWFKEAEDVEPIVGPLCRMIEQLPKSTLKAFEKRANSIMLVGGTCAIVVPDIIGEVKIRREEANIARQEKAGGAARPHYPTRQDATRNQGVGVSNGQQSPDRPLNWTDALPTPDLQVDFQ